MLTSFLLALLGQSSLPPPVDPKTVWAFYRACLPAVPDDPKDDGFTYFTALIVNHSDRPLDRLSFKCRLIKGNETLYESTAESTTENAFAVDPKTCYTVKSPGLVPTGRLNVVLKLKAPVDAVRRYDGYWIELVSAEGKLPAKGQSVFDAARQGDEELLKGLLKADPKAVTATDANGNTPLHLACLAQKIRCVDLLLGAGADANARNRDDIQPIHYASATWGPGRERAWTIESLIAGGADANAPSRAVGSPLAIAALHDDTAAVRLLLQKRADPNLKGAWPCAVYEAAKAGHIPMMAALLASGGDPNATSLKGRPAVVAAAARGDGPLNVLIRAGAKLDVTDPVSGRTALHEAADGGLTGNVTMLLKAGARRVLKDKDGKTALDLARAEGYAPIVALLEKP